MPLLSPPPPNRWQAICQLLSEVQAYFDAAVAVLQVWPGGTGWCEEAGIHAGSTARPSAARLMVVCCHRMESGGGQAHQGLLQPTAQGQPEPAQRPGIALKAAPELERFLVRPCCPILTQCHVQLAGRLCTCWHCTASCLTAPFRSLTQGWPGCACHCAPPCPTLARARCALRLPHAGRPAGCVGPAGGAGSTGRAGGAAGGAGGRGTTPAPDLPGPALRVRACAGWLAGSLGCSCRRLPHPALLFALAAICPDATN